MIFIKHRIGLKCYSCVSSSLFGQYDSSCETGPFTKTSPNVMECPSLLNSYCIKMQEEIGGVRALTRTCWVGAEKPSGASICQKDYCNTGTLFNMTNLSYIV